MNNLLVVLFVALSVSCHAPAGSPDFGAPDRGTDAGAPQEAGPQDAAPPPSSFGGRRIPGRWFAGDFHVHSTGASNDTGAESTPERIREVAIERGLEFVVLTDHSNSTGSDTTTRDEDPALFNLGPEFPYWDKAAMLSDEMFLMVDGNEISPVHEPPTEPTCHIGCYPLELDTFNPNIAFRDRPRSSLTCAEIVPQAREAGCFVTVNHPFVVTSWMAFDWTTRDYDALEVFNGGAGWDKFDHLAVLGWACDLALGRDTVAIGGSDNHRIETEPPGILANPPLGRPTTWVWSGALDWKGIIAGLQDGRVSVGDTGVALELDVYDAAKRWLGLQGDEVASGEVAWLRARGALHNSEGEARKLQFVRVRSGACNDTRTEFEITAPEPELEVLAEFDVEPGVAFDEAVEVELAPGDVAFVWLRPPTADVLGAHGVAVTNAIRAR